MINPIRTQKELFIVEDIISELDYLIDRAYSELEKETREDKIISLQNLIDVAKKKQVGYIGLSQIYKSKINKTKNIKTYEVKEGDTLVMISQAFYGESVFWQYIYFENALVTDELTVGQQLIIPKLPKVPEPVLFYKDIYVADAVNIDLGIT